MKRFVRQFIGDGAFYRMVFAVTLPIMVQNFITNFVSMLDNIMVGALGTEQMSGVAIVNQILFVYNLAIFGVISGIGIFTAQFYGKGDEQGIRQTVRLKFISCAVVTLLGCLIIGGLGDQLISSFLHRGEYEGDLALTFSFARQYLDVILWQLPFIMLAQTIAGTMRETGETIVPMISGLCAVAVNCTMNLVLIFGYLGFPALGVVGAAIATLLSRVVEVAILALYFLLNKRKFPYVKGMLATLSIPQDLLLSIFKKGTPLMLNEFFWAFGMTLLSVSYSRHGVDVVAAYSITSTVTNLFNISFMAFGIGIGIIVGNKLGENRFEEAVDTVKKMMAVSITVSVLVGVVSFLLSGTIVGFFKTSDISREIAAYFIRVSALMLPMIAFVNGTYFTLRSGGKTVVTFLFDSVFVCLFQVPLAFLLTELCHLDIYWVYPIVHATDLIKVITGGILVKKRIWVNNIVETKRILPATNDLSE